MVVSGDAGRSAGAAAGARRGALTRAVRFTDRFTDRFAARLAGRFTAFARRAEPARRAALFFFDRLDIFFLFDVRDFAALLVFFRRFLAMRVPPALPAEARSAQAGEMGARILI